MTNTITYTDTLLHHPLKLNAGKDYRLFLGVGFLNSKGEVAESVPLDFLIFLNTTRKLNKQISASGGSLNVDFYIADINAKQQIEAQETDCNIVNEKLVALDNAVLNFQSKFTLWTNNMGISDCVSTTLGSSFHKSDAFQKVAKTTKITGQENLNPYALEQLLTMKAYKEEGYDGRLSWSPDLTKEANRDERFFDNLYKSCLKEEPLQSIYTIGGKKVGGTAVPYSFYHSEEGNRLTLDKNYTESEVASILTNKSYRKHCHNILPDSQKQETNATPEIISAAVFNTIQELNRVQQINQTKQRS